MTILEKQSIVSQILDNAFSKDQLSHAYLFSGPKGVGKQEKALSITKAYFCNERVGAEPCNKCSNCNRINSRNHPDVFLIGPDGNTIKKEQIQQLQHEFSYAGFEGNKKVYIILEAEKMSTSAANSLLKFLEEPNKGTMAILTTEEPNRILTTILSRCQQLKFQSLSSIEYTQQLVNEGNIARNDVKLVASITNNYQEALDLYNSEDFHEKKVKIIEFTKALLENRRMGYILVADFVEIFKERKDLYKALDLVTLFIKDVLYVKLKKSNKVCFIEEEKYLNSAAGFFELHSIVQRLEAIGVAQQRTFSNVPTKLILEQMLIRANK